MGCWGGEGVGVVRLWAEVFACGGAGGDKVPWTWVEP